MKYLGIDIGGTNIKYGIFNEFGIEDITQIGEVKTINDDLDKFLDLIVSIIGRFDNLDGVGFSIPGGINAKTGEIIEGGAIPVLGGINIKQVLYERLGINIAAENDANCCALAEKWIGNGVDAENFICVTIGTGIGGGVIINNKLFAGNRFFVGEFGYMMFNSGEEEIKDCKTTSYHCSTASLVIKTAQALDMNREDLNGKMIFEMIEQENQKVIEVYERWVRDLSIAIANLGFAFDPDKILLGGGVSSVDKVINDVRKHVASINIYAARWEIDNCAYFNNSGKIGAVYNYIVENSK